jgi:hypothetical protein
VKSYLGIDDRDALSDVSAKLRHAICALDPALESCLPALGALLDTPVDDREWPFLDSGSPRCSRHTRQHFA